MSSRDLKRALREKLGITRQRLSARAATIKQKHGPMSTDDAVYLMAVDAGFDLSKHLDQETVDRIRQLRQAAVPTRLAQPVRRVTRSPSKTVQVTVGRAFTLTDPILPARILNEAKTMAEQVYPMLYVFENSVREFIRRVLRAALGENWWEVAVPPEVKREVEKRKAKEDKEPWHGRRNAQDIYYTNLDDLRRIVTSNSNWPHFASLLPSQNWFASRISESTLSRNIAAHHNPLASNDVKRLEVYFQDWQNQVAAIRDRLP